MKKVLSVIFAILLSVSMIAVSAAAESEDYVIVSPYSDVVWSGDGAWKAYKGNLHTHSTVSDGRVDFRDMIMEYYRQGYDFLAMTEHGVTGREWNDKPTFLPLYLYQYIIGNKVTPLTDEEYEGIKSGTYPVDGRARGYGMTCVTGGNELNAVTVTKCHVNGMFLPEHVGDNYWGFENDHEGAVRLADKAGGISFINHPGDWLWSNRDSSVVSDPKNIKYFGDIILKYDSCLGMEVFNEHNSVTPHDRVLFDNILMYCLPYGKRVIAFSNSDAHTLDRIDSSFSVFMMPRNDSETIKATMQSGAFFCVTRDIKADEKIGPEKGVDAKNSGLPYPEFTMVTVDGHSVTVRGRNCNKMQWIANGDVIASKTVEQSSDETEWTVDLDTIDGAKDFLYIRCELFGDGGCALTQALVIDNGAQPLKFVPDTSIKAKLNNLWHRFCSLRIFAIIYAIVMRLK
ncbi:MAG: hypothetical protein K6B52_08840 [Clostridiales bacterium]|nr:hypothetical protein [Clostridiales bacterium]